MQTSMIPITSRTHSDHHIKGKVLYSNSMKPQSLLEFLDAAHLSSFVESDFGSRGGIMLVGPPNTLKSTMVEAAYNPYPNALVLSDLNVQQLARLRDDLSGGRYPTIAFTAFEKLYARHAATSSNLEGYLLALVEEGFTRVAFEDSRMAAIKAKALVVGATTISFYSRKYQDWHDSGFLRRFLWLVYRVDDPRKLENAIHKWELLPIDSIQRKAAPTGSIKYNLSVAESTSLLTMAKEQPDRSTGFILLKKIAIVLKWKYTGTKTPERWIEILRDIAPALSSSGSTIVL